MTEAAITALVLTTIAAATKKISALPASAGVEYDDFVAVVNVTATRTEKATVAQLMDRTVGTFITAAQLRALEVATIADNSLFYIKGIVSPGDGGEGFYYYDAGSVAVDNTGTVIEPTSGTGAFLRVYSGAVNIRWFGATGDGVTDDTAAIQAAINWAITSTGGGEVFAPQGNYKVASPIAINANTYNKLRIYGVGFNTTFKHTAGAFCFKIDNSGGSSVSLLLLELFAVDATGNAAANAAIYFNAAGRSLVSRCYLINYSKTSGTEIQKGYPIILADATVGLVTVRDCHLGNGYGGIYSVANGVQIKDCIFEVTTGPGIYIAGGAGITVAGCRMQTIGTYGVNCPVGGAIAITNSYFEGCTTHSIYCGSSSQVRGLNITGNCFTGTTGTHHVNIEFAHGVNIDANFFNTSGSVGLIKVGGAEVTVGLYIGCSNGLSAAVLASYTMLTETNPTRYGLIYDILTFTWNPGTLTRWGNMLGTAQKTFGVQNGTNNGVYNVGGYLAFVQLLDNQSITITLGAGAIISVEDGSLGFNGAFFASYDSATIVELADPSTKWAVTNTDSGGNWAIYKIGASSVVTIKNYNNASSNIRVQILGSVVSATAPA